MSLKDFEYRCVFGDEIEELGNIVKKERKPVIITWTFWCFFCGLVGFSMLMSLVFVRENYNVIQCISLGIMDFFFLFAFSAFGRSIRRSRAVIKSVNTGCFEVADAVVLEKPTVSKTVGICYSHLWDMKGNKTEFPYRYMRDYDNLFEKKGSISIKVVRVVVSEKKKDWVYELLVPEYKKG